MSFQKWLRIVIPEVQLLDYIKQHGFLTKKNRGNLSSRNQTMTRTVQETTNHPTMNRHTGSLNQSTPLSTGSVKEVATDAKRGVQQLRTTTNNNQIDEIFEKISHFLKLQVQDQELFIEQLVVAFKRAFLHRKRGQIQQKILTSGPEGTGKMLSLTLLIEQLYQHRLIPYRKVIEIDLSHYSEREIHTNFVSDCAAAFEYGIGTVCFKKVETAPKEVLDYIISLVNHGFFRTEAGITVDAKDYFIIFSLDGDFSSAEESVHKLPSTLKLDAVAQTKPLSKEAMQKIAQQLLAKLNQQLRVHAHFTFTYQEEVVAFIAELARKSKKYSKALEAWINKDISNALIDLRATRKINPEDEITLTVVDEKVVATVDNVHHPVFQKVTEKGESLELLLKELHDLTGLDNVKTFVQELIDTVKVQQMRKKGGKKDLTLTLHMIFSGNPGTGKTTVARLIGRIFKAMGILSTGQLIETARQDLVGEYVGSTAPKTNAKIQEALGGVLFIDEAYTLSRQKNDPFGQEAIDTIVKGMEDHRENLVVILAGYTKEMSDFLRSNPGLPSRFPFQIEFGDYKPEEMLEICLLLASQRDYTIDPEAKADLVQLFAKKQVPGRNDSGNGRLVRNLLEEAIRKQSARLADASQEETIDLNLLKKEDFGITEEVPFLLEEKLHELIGLDNVKTFLRTLEKQILVNKRRKEAGITTKTEQTLNMIFSGNPGTGKTTIARFVAEMLRNLGVIKRGHLVEVGRSELVAAYVGQTAEKTKEVVERALGGVLFIDEAYALVDKNGGGFGEEAVNELVRLVEIHKDNLVVILAGYTDDMQEFLRVNPGLSSRFPLQLEFPDYAPEEMVQITEIMASAKGFHLSEGFQPALKAWYETKQIAGKKDIGNGRLVRNKLEEAIRKQAVRIADEIELTNEELTRLTAYDFDLEERAVEQSAFEELEKIIGQEEVKSFVMSLFAQIEMNHRRKALGLPDMGRQSLHMVFKGNPGTGKTTIARIVAKRLKEINMIKSDTVVETDRSGLVAGYVGQTALKTKEVIDRALGGVLFIDEAYSLASDSFGKEAIDTLVKAMEDYKDELVVIVAGYDQDMENFLNINAGLRSRFPHIITFKDYTPKELLKISRLVFHSKGYKASKEAEEKLLEVFQYFDGKSDSGNGRLVRNICEDSIRHHAVRYAQNLDATVEQLTTIESEDIQVRGVSNND